MGRHADRWKAHTQQMTCASAWVKDHPDESAYRAYCAGWDKAVTYAVPELDRAYALLVDAQARIRELEETLNRAIVPCDPAVQAAWKSFTTTKHKDITP